MTIFGQRLKQARKAAGMTQIELGKLVGIKPPSISEAEQVGLSSTKTLEYAKALKVNPEWLATGKGKMELDDSQSYGVAVNHDAIQIPLLNIVASMGEGMSNKCENVLEMITICKSWANQALRPFSSEGNLAFIHAIGDSMHPTFNDGDVLLVDTGDKSVTADKIYVVKAHDRLFIKRIRQRLDGIFEISSDNPSIKTVDVLNGDHEVEVKGRVLWVWNGRKL